MKDSPYLTHDIGARNDPKLVKVQMELGGIGLGIYWCLVEMLWENGGYLPFDPATLAFSLRWARVEDVQKVLTEFGLFENDGERVWSASALERINHKKKISEVKAGAGRRGGLQKAANRASSDSADDSTELANAKQMLEGALADDEAVPAPINKLNNKLINKSRNFSIPPSAADRKRLLEIFFFDRNFSEPDKEVERFVSHYAARGWNFGDGQPVQDLFAAAQNWKPSNGGQTQYPKPFLDWYKMVYACYINAGNDPEDMLAGLVNAKGRGKDVTLTYRTAEIGLRVRNFVWSEKLEQGWQIDWKKAN